VIATITMNPAVDKSSRIEHVTPEKKLRCKPPQFYPGGGGVNISRVIRELGGDSSAVYSSGGPVGDMLDELLAREHIKTFPVRIKGWTRENLTIYEEASNQQYRFGMPGPHLKSTEWKQCLERLFSFDPEPRYIAASGSLPPGVPDNFFALIAQRAQKNGSRLIVDTSGKALKKAAQAGAYLLKPNMRELEEMTGKQISSESQQENAAEKIVKECRCTVLVISLGAAGALMVTDEGSKRMRAPSVPIKSKVGAGDSMVAGITLGLSKGYELEDAVRFGIAAGAAAVMTPGTELCKRKDVKRLYDSIKE
jgi:6-phosphofructokinase 2